MSTETKGQVKQFLHIDDHLAMLNEYAPHKPTMHLTDGRGVQTHFVLVGIDFSEKLVLTQLATGGNTQHWHVSEAQMVLHSLADLPNLPGGDALHASPVAAFIHGLGFIERGDHASGEWVNQVTVKSASDAQLHLAFSTTYQQDTSQWSDDDFDEQQEPTDNAGSDYEVIVAATGTVHWRCVTADNLDVDNKSRQHWRIAEGANVIEAFRYLRQLHVAVGKAAYVHQVWSNATQKHTPHYSYVRKLVTSSHGGEGAAQK